MSKTKREPVVPQRHLQTVINALGAMRDDRVPFHEGGCYHATMSPKRHAALIAEGGGNIKDDTVAGCVMKADPKCSEDEFTVTGAGKAKKKCRWDDDAS